MDFWMEITAVVWDGDKAVWRDSHCTAREAFHEAWDQVRSEWIANPRPLNIVVSVGTDSRLGTTLTVRTAVGAVGKRTRCVCPVCGWDEARMSRRELRIRDEFNLLVSSPIEALVSDGPRTMTAEWVDIQCALCPELDAAGLDRGTKRPV